MKSNQIFNWNPILYNNKKYNIQYTLSISVDKIEKLLFIWFYLFNLINVSIKGYRRKIKYCDYITICIKNIKNTVKIAKKIKLYYIKITD